MYETAVGVVAAEITTLPAGLAGIVSALVARVRFAAVIVCAGGFVIPTIVKAPLPLLARAQVPPLLASVSVTVGPVAEPAVPVVTAVAAQFV